jgi:UDPglucose 6-dehydrogenase
MCLPTPYLEDGSSNLSYLLDATDTIAKVLLNRSHDSRNNFVLLINKSTVPIGTATMLNEHIRKLGLANFEVASNPEFLPEGDAVKSAIHAHKVIIGAFRKESFEILREIYSVLVNSQTYIETNPETAEAIKYAANALLYAFIVTWQAIPGKIGEGFPQVDFDIVKRGILADNRITTWGSYLSAGAGGSCFKKDILSLAHQLDRTGVDSSFARMIDTINEHHKSYLIERAEREANYDFTGKTVALLGAAFKQDTNDMRESNVLKVVPELLKRGVKEIKVYDPLALMEAKKYFDPMDSGHKKISYHSVLKDVLVGADVSYIATDHNEFRALSDLLIPYTNKPHLVIDGRRMIYSTVLPKLLRNGISYLAIGGTFRKADDEK